MPADANTTLFADQPHKELQFYSEFQQAACDVHLALLEEAHRKHGVYINVPPQLPPAGTPPEVPDVVFSDVQSERLRTIKLAYAPTHGPPPLATTGTRGLAEMLADEDAAALKAKQPKATADGEGHAAKKPDGASPSPSTSIGSGNTVPQEMQRLPIEATNRFHCSQCGKSFRIRLSAEHHVAQQHPGSAIAAQVLDGAGPGELLEGGKLDAADCAQSTSRQQQSPAPTAATATRTDDLVGPKSSADYKKLVVGVIPTDEEVDALLIALWDPQGLARCPRAGLPTGTTAGSPVAVSTSAALAFVSVADAVVGVADNRKPQSELDLLPSIRATPEGAAPGIKRAPVGPLSKDVSGKVVPMKELSARFPNPFGDSAESKLMALLKDEPLNPFLPLHPVDPEPGSGRVAGSPSLAAAATLRRFKCHLCSSSFRLQDALAEHCETSHGIEMPPEALLATQGAATIQMNPYVVQKEGPKGAVASKGQGDGSAASDGAGTDGSSDGNSSASGGLTEEERGVLPPTPVVDATVNVHLRAASNVVLLGEVVDVQSGYIKNHRVVQYVVKTTNPTSAALPPGDGTEATPPPAGVVGAADEEEEFMVVRAFVENMKYVTDGVKLGSWIMVHGSLRLNRHSDSTSRRLHAYPVVQVVAPMGTIVLVEGS